MRKLKLLFAAAALMMGATATWAEDVDYTSYITNANLSSTDGWTLQATGGSWSNVQGSSPSYVIEAYAGWDPLSLTAYSMKQNVTLPSGKYRAEGYAFYRYGINATTDASKSYAKFVAGDFSAPVVTLGGEALDGTLTAYPNNTDQASAAFTNGYYKSQVEFAIESESTIAFGYEGTHVLRQSWFIAGPIKLYRTGDFDYSLYQSQLEGLVNDAKALLSSTMAASIKTALNSVISTYDGQTCSSVADYNTAYAALNAAIANANTSIASYAIIASGTVSTSSLDGWTCTNSNTFHINTWSDEGNPGNDPSGMTTPFIENWVASGTYLGEGTFSYTIEGLEPGEVYYAQALIRSYNEKSSDAPNGPNFFINDTDIDLTKAGTTFTYKNKSGIYATLGGAATVGADGKLTLGARIASTANYNWVAFKNVSIRSMDDALDAAVAKVTALEGNVPTTVYNTAYAVVVANTGANKPGTASEYETAIAAIENAATTASAFVSTFATWKAMKADAEVMQAVENTNSEANATLASAITTQATAANAATTTEGIETATAALKTAMRTYFDAAKPTSGNTFNVTFTLNNPSFESNFTGWTNSGMATQGNTSFGKTGNIYVESWQPNGTKSVKQTLTNMPTGQYRISADIKARGVTSAKIFGGSEETAVTIADAENNYSVDFVYTGSSDFIFGFEGVGTGEGASWIALDNFTLTYLRELTVAEAKEGLNDAISTANAIVTAKANVGSGVFQIPESAWSTLSDAKTTAQGVYNDSEATVSAVQTATSDLNTAIETYNNTTLNIPAADQHYNLVVTQDGHAKNGNPVIIIPGATSANNPTGYALNANFASNTNLAQTVTFTHVSGNTYNIVFESVAGKAYLTTGTQNGSAAGWADSQIQATTEAEDKGTFKIVATTTDNVFNIYNTITNKTVDCQAGGNIYTEDGSTGFSVAEASQASVDLTIDAAVKYATRIFPFTPALPSGVTAYSCEAAAENTLTLAAVATPAANTPYILFAEEGNTGSLSGWGTASATTYTTGWLTGTYEEMAAPNESFILQNQSGKVGFYQVDTKAATPMVRANRAYMTISSAGARAYFFAEGEATAVKALNTLMSGKAEIFNLKGERIGKLQKGMNIIKTEGKIQKVMVK